MKSFFKKRYQIINRPLKRLKALYVPIESHGLAPFSLNKSTHLNVPPPTAPCPLQTFFIFGVNKIVLLGDHI